MAVEALYKHGSSATMADYTPVGAVTGGTVVVVADFPRVVHVSIEAGVLGAIAIGGGVYDCIADGAIASGKNVWWDDTANKITLTAAANTHFGDSVSASLADGNTILVRHAPHGPDLVV